MINYKEFYLILKLRTNHSNTNKILKIYKYLKDSF